MRDQVADAAAGDDADQTRNHERMVQDILADARHTRAVKPNTCEIRRIGESSMKNPKTKMIGKR